MLTINLVTTLCLSTLSGCSTQTPLSNVVAESNSTPSVLDRTISTEEFALEAINLMGSTLTKCDAGAIADKSTNWTCAAYSDSYESFIEKWEKIAATSEFKEKYKLKSSSDWMYFNQGDEIDFYARSYRVASTQAMIAYDPSEKGREIFIGINPRMTLLMARADGLVSMLGHSESKPASPQRLESEPTGPQRNALRSANNYIKLKGFSRAGLIDQLSSEYGDGYSVEDATAAMETLDVDWSAQAVRSANDYLKFKGFSCNGLIEQLSSSYGDKFTLKEARYGAQQTNACE